MYHIVHNLKFTISLSNTFTLKNCNFKSEDLTLLPPREVTANLNPKYIKSKNGLIT